MSFRTSNRVEESNDLRNKNRQYEPYWVPRTPVDDCRIIRQARGAHYRDAMGRASYFGLEITQPGVLEERRYLCHF